MPWQKFSTVWFCVFYTLLLKSFVFAQVFGGEPAKTGDIPYIVSIQKYGSHICGGSILDEYHILTAAHCVISKRQTTKPSDLTIRYGVTNLAKDNTNTVQVADFKYHENYNENIMFHDIAILTLAEKIILSDTVKVIKLPAPHSNVPENSPVILSGWGKTKNYGLSANDLQVVDITMYSDDECEGIYKEFSYKSNRKYQVCAGVFEGQKGQCSGDSGGPLVIRDTTNQVGIVSWSRKPQNKCASKGSPGVFVKVANYIRWINKNRQKQRKRKNGEEGGKPTSSSGQKKADKEKEKQKSHLEL